MITIRCDMATLKEKDKVLNPLRLRNNVGEELADILEAHDIKNPEEYIGIKNLRHREILPEKKLNIVANKLNIPELVEYLTSFQKEYLEEKPRYEESYKQAKETYQKLKNAVDYLRNDFTGGCDILEDILDFFDAETEDEILNASEQQATLFRKQNRTEVNSINLYVLLRRGELDFKAMTLPDYNEKNLLDWISSKEWSSHIEDVEYFKSLPSILASFGVGLVLIRSLPKTVYGAVRWFDNKPLIQVSDHGKDLATCWFILFHELGHVIKHKNVEIYEGNINDKKEEQNKQEKEANKFANQYLFNGDNLRKAVFNRKYLEKDISADELAKEFSVSPIFTTYWLIKAQYKPKQQQKHRFHIEFSC